MFLPLLQCLLKMLDERRARDLLKTFCAPREVVEHSETVHDVCMDLVGLLRETNPTLRINRRIVAVGALLHDIGRTKSQGVDHGVVGARIIRDLNATSDSDLEKIAKICERHVGAGITCKEAKKLGLPQGDYIPKTLEEKIVAYCDNLVDDSGGIPIVRDPSWAAVDFEKKHGKRSEPARLVRELNAFFEDLLA